MEKNNAHHFFLKVQTNIKQFQLIALKKKTLQNQEEIQKYIIVLLI